MPWVLDALATKILRVSDLWETVGDRLVGIVAFQCNSITSFFRFLEECLQGLLPVVIRYGGGRRWAALSMVAEERHPAKKKFSLMRPKQASENDDEAG